MALRASGLWLSYTTLQNEIPSSPWIAPPRPPPWRNPRKGRDKDFAIWQPYLLTRVGAHVEELCLEVPVVRGPPGEEEGAPVRPRQPPHVQQDLVAEHVDVELVRDVQDQLHELVVAL